MIAGNVRSLSAWGVVVAAALLVGGVWWSSASATEGEQAVSATFAVESYAQVCARCHGLNGGGGEVPATGEPVPALVDNPDITTAYLDLVMLTGRMPPAGDPFDNREREIFYTDAERAAMVVWMAEEFGIEGEIPEVVEGDVARGLEVFARNCAHCHGNAGAGGTAGQAAFTPRVNDLPGLAIAEAIRVGPFEMPAFSEDVISDEDVGSVVAYLEEVNDESGTPFLGLVELNPVFASGFVGLLSLMLLGSLVYLASRPVALEGLIENPEGLEDAFEAEPDGSPAKEDEE